MPQLSSQEAGRAAYPGGYITGKQNNNNNNNRPLTAVIHTELSNCLQIYNCLQICHSHNICNVCGIYNVYRSATPATSTAITLRYYNTQVLHNYTKTIKDFDSHQTSSLFELPNISELFPEWIKYTVKAINNGTLDICSRTFSRMVRLVYFYRSTFTMSATPAYLQYLQCLQDLQHLQHLQPLQH